MTNEPIQEDVQLASPLPVIISGLVNGVIFCVVWYMAFKNHVEPSRSQLFTLNVGFLLSTIVIAQIFFRRTIATQVTFVKLWVAGWMSSLFFALVVSIFYHYFFPTIDMKPPSFTQVLISYNTMGLVISAIVSFFITRIK
ncbi:MAG: hypothetical protein KDD32_11215 [Bacteroidetes bacterium]|nr:hypothetical protein [Bacteroidota bacterium]